MRIHWGKGVEGVYIREKVLRVYTSVRGPEGVYNMGRVLREYTLGKGC